MEPPTLNCTPAADAGTAVANATAASRRGKAVDAATELLLPVPAMAEPRSWRRRKEGGAWGSLTDSLAEIAGA